MRFFNLERQSRSQHLLLAIFNRNLLRQHAITRYKIAFRHKAPTQFRFSEAANLHNVLNSTAGYAVALTAYASNRIEVSSRTKLVQLVLGEIVRQQLQAAAMGA